MERAKTKRVQKFQEERRKQHGLQRGDVPGANRPWCPLAAQQRGVRRLRRQRGSARTAVVATEPPGRHHTRAGRELEAATAAVWEVLPLPAATTERTLWTDASVSTRAGVLQRAFAAAAAALRRRQAARVVRDAYLATA